MADFVPAAVFSGGHHAVHVETSQRERAHFHRRDCHRLRLHRRFHRGQRLGHGRTFRQLAVHRRPEHRLRSEARSLERDDDVRRHRRRRRDPYLFLRLHGRRPQQGALLRVHEPVHVLDARHRAGEQFHRDVHLLGTRRRVQLPAHRVLVRKTQRGRRGEKSLLHQPPRRLRISAWDFVRLGAARLAEFCAASIELSSPIPRRSEPSPLLPAC